jgi:hypothetical protein
MLPRIHTYSQFNIYLTQALDSILNAYLNIGTIIKKVSHHHIACDAYSPASLQSDSGYTRAIALLCLNLKLLKFFTYVLHFSVVIFYWSFRIIYTSTIKCWELSTAQAGAKGREGCCTYSLSLMYSLTQSNRVCNSLVILLWLMLQSGITFVSDFFFLNQ